MPGVILVSGPKGTGKTHFIKCVIYQLAKKNMFDFIKVICPTSYNGSYSFLPKKHVTDSYNELALHDLLNKQVELMKRKQPRRMILILDDCIGSANFRSPIWEKLATTCRHPHLTIIVVTQHIFRLPPTLRDNSDTVIMLRTIDIDNLQGLYDTCGRVKWRKFSDFEEFVRLNTTDYKAIVINKGNSVQVVRAPSVLKKFKLEY